MRKQTLVLVMIAVMIVAMVGGQDAQANGNIIPEHRLADWTNVGVPGGIPTLAVVANVKDYGAKGDGVSNDTAAVKAAIEDVGANGGGAVYFPAGNYLITEQLRVTYNNVVLRGAGPELTKMTLNIAETSDAISIRAYQGFGEYAAVSAGYTRGSTTLTVDDGAKFKVGEFAEIVQDNDPAMFTKPEFDKEWADESVGQIFQITAINGNTLTINDPLILTFKPELNVRARALRVVQGSGIEEMHVVRVDADNAYMIDLQRCIYCWVKNIEGEMAYRAHVRLDRCYRCEIRDSYFHHAHSYGDGGHGYGVSLANHTTKGLIENNMFYYLRHAMILGTGSIGNVFGYNYSGHSFQYLADISLHGHFPNYNLFEGNIVQDIQSADNWGPSGPGNTFFRNAVELTNLRQHGFRIVDHSHDHNVVGNIIAGEFYVDPSVSGTLAHGNKVAGVISWDPNIASRDLPASYYRTSKPAFFGDMPWPSVGSDLSTYDLPARRRYLQMIGEDPGGPVPTPTVDLKLTAPTGTLTATRGNPTYTWEHEADITTYQIYVNPSSNVYAPVFYGSLAAADYCSGAQCSVDLTDISGAAWLSNNTYHVYLAAGNTWNLTPSVFTVNVPQPSMVSMQGVTGTSSGQPTISWSLGGAADHNSWFHIYIAPTASLTTPALDTWVERSTVCNGTNCTFQVPQALGNNHYSAYIQGWGPGGLSTGGLAGWAGPMEFNLGPARPNIPSNVDVTLNNRVPTITWNDDANATEFNVYVGITNPITQVYYVTVSRADACNSGTCRFVAPDAFPAGVYHAFVQAEGAGGIGLNAANPLGWSAEALFTVN